jgi:hypothetical protein
MQLPVSGIEVQFRAPNGDDDLALLEAGRDVMGRSLTLLEHLALVPEADGSSLQGRWACFTVADFEVALLGLRRFLLGDRVNCVFRCGSKDCGERIETEFSITDFLGEVVTSAPERAKPRENRKGWFEFGELLFRLPTVDDQVRVMRQTQAHRLLARRCVEGTSLKTRDLMRVERAMENIAPLVSRPLTGNCPECGEQVSMLLHVPTLVSDEFTLAAASIHDDVDAIAEAYHWDEAAILAMPQSRRRAYVETIRRNHRMVV